MVNLLEADYGLGPLRDVEAAITAGVRALYRRNKEQAWFDGLWINEYGEVLHGALLVAAQTYCVGAVVDINEIRRSEGLAAVNKMAAYHAYSIVRNERSVVELVNAAANCFKHRDEWGDSWPDNETTRTLTAYSIAPDTEFPVNHAILIITTELGYPRLSDLLAEWRGGMILKLKKERQQRLPCDR